MPRAHHDHRRDGAPSRQAAGPRPDRRGGGTAAGAGTPAGPGPLSPQAVQALQRAIGNAAVTRMLTVRRAGDEDGPGPGVPGVLRRPGTPLDGPLRAEMEARLGADFSTVRLHTGPAAQRSAAALDARAYTSGEHIVLGRGGGDRHTLAHELTHVIQQRSGPVAGTDNGAGLSVSDPSDAFERAAEESATRALRGPLPGEGAGPAAVPGAAGRPGPGGPAGQRPVQRARIVDIDSGRQLDDEQIHQIMDWLSTTELTVPVQIPTGESRLTRRQAAHQGRATDPRLDAARGVAAIKWHELIRGEPMRLSYGPRDVYVRPDSGGVLGAAVGELVPLQDDPVVGADRTLGPFVDALMDWLVRRRSSSSGGRLNVDVRAARSNEGTGAHVEMAGRPGWDTAAGQIVTTNTEDRRHIIAWHTMRDAFQNVFNRALAPGEHPEDRLRELIRVLEEESTWTELDREQAQVAAADSDGDVEMAEASQPAQPAESAESAESASVRGGSPMSGVLTGDGPGPSASGGTTSAELRTRLCQVIDRVMRLLSNNPFNLWAGESVANQSINRVRQQLAARLAEYTDDGELLDRVRDRARDGAGRANEDQRVWTEVRDTLNGVVATDARTFIQSIVDSFDIDIPVTGQDATSTTYRALADQAAVTGNILATGLAQEVLRMADGDLPADFDTLIEQMRGWLRRFLRPESLETSTDHRRRTVGARPRPGAG